MYCLSVHRKLFMHNFFSIEEPPEFYDSNLSDSSDNMNLVLDESEEDLLLSSPKKTGICEVVDIQEMAVDSQLSAILPRPPLNDGVDSEVLDNKLDAVDSQLSAILPAPNDGPDSEVLDNVMDAVAAVDSQLSAILPGPPLNDGVGSEVLDNNMDAVVAFFDEESKTVPLECSFTSSETDTMPLTVRIKHEEIRLEKRISTPTKSKTLKQVLNEIYGKYYHYISEI